MNDPETMAALAGLRLGLGIDNSATPAARLARRFHEAYERLAPAFGYTTRADTREFDPMSKNGQLMIAVCAEILYDAPKNE